MTQRSKLSNSEQLQLRWECFRRYGLQTPYGRISAWGVLLRWCLSLFIIHFTLQVSGFLTRPLFGFGQVAYDGDGDVVGQGFWRGRHLIFSASAGRAGSAYLSSVLECAENVYALHEPDPKMNDEDLRRVLLKGQRAETLDNRRARKLGAIRDAMLGTEESVVYAETSHMFIKTFADAILTEVGDISDAKVTVIVPKRDLHDTIMSQLRLGWFSSNHSGRGTWYYAPRDLHESEVYINRNTSGADMSSITDVVEYNLDISKRIEALKALIEQRHTEGRWPGVQIIEESIKEIAPEKEHEIANFLRTLGLTPIIQRIRMLQVDDENRRYFKKDRASVQVDSRLVHLVLQRFRS